MFKLAVISMEAQDGSTGDLGDQHRQLRKHQISESPGPGDNGLMLGHLRHTTNLSEPHTHPILLRYTSDSDNASFKVLFTVTHFNSEVTPQTEPFLPHVFFIHPSEGELAPTWQGRTSPSHLHFRWIHTQ